jgi:hypothetical protein
MSKITNAFGVERSLTQEQPQLQVADFFSPGVKQISRRLELDDLNASINASSM